MRCYAQVAILFAGIASFLALPAKAETKEEATPDAQKIPLVAVEVQRNSKDVTAPFTIKATIVNTTNAPIVLRSLKAIVPAALQRSERDASKWQQTPLQDRVLSQGQKVVERISVPAAFILKTLLFVSSSWETGATLFYDLENIEQQTPPIETTVSIEWQGSIWGKLFGGLIGCGALALFLSSRQIGGPARQYKRTFLFVSSFLSTFTVGVATVLAATLLIAFLTPGSLPISFSVEDWRGGALLGLFSVPIGGWLLDKLSAAKLAANEKKEKAKRQQMEK
jgi:hypothetical protein